MNAQLFQVAEQVDGAPVGAAAGDDLVPGGENAQQGHGQSCHPRRGGDGPDSALQLGDPLLKGGNGGVSDAGVGKAHGFMRKDLFQGLKAVIPKCVGLGDGGQGASVGIGTHGLAVEKFGVEFHAIHLA